jgi:GAF domain-containing protein
MTIHEEFRTIVIEEAERVGNADLAAITERVYDRLDADTLRTLALRALRDRIAGIVAVRPSAIPTAGPPLSAKWNAVANWFAVAQIEIAQQERIMLRDATSDDLLAAAELHREQAAEHLAAAVRFEELAVKLKDTRGATRVADLGLDIIHSILRPTEAAR